MKTARHRVVLVTTPDLKTARQLAKGALANHLVACANLIPGIESHYWWQDRIENGKEVLVLFKTAEAKLAALEKYVVAHHPYDTPEFIVLAVAAGNSRYLDWIDQSLAEKKMRQA